MGKLFDWGMTLTLAGAERGGARSAGGCAEGVAVDDGG